MEIDNEKNLLVHAGTVLAGDDLEPLPNAFIEIKNGLIKSVEKVAGPLPAGKIKDLSHLTVLPGPVDCHVHLALDGIDFHHCLKSWEHPAAAEQLIKENIDYTISHGITVVRDGGDKKALVLNLKNKEKHPLKILASGTALRRENMYGSFLGPGLTADQLREAIAEAAFQGADQVKILTSGLVSFKEYGKVGPVQFEKHELETITEEAKRRGLKVMAHASSDRAVKLCALSRVDTIEHGYFASEETLKIMAENYIHWLPTLTPVYNQLIPPCSENFPPQQLEIIKRTVERHKKLLLTARQLNVPVAVGTDAGAAGVLHGRGFHKELALYKEAGLSNYDILRAATIEGSKAAGVGPGLAPGQPARFIAVKGNPLQDLNTLKHPTHLVTTCQEDGSGDKFQP